MEKAYPTKVVPLNDNRRSIAVVLKRLSFWTRLLHQGEEQLYEDEIYEEQIREEENDKKQISKAQMGLPFQ
jgi:hypothetical protein